MVVGVGDGVVLVGVGDGVGAGGLVVVRSDEAPRDDARGVVSFVMRSFSFPVQWDQGRGVGTVGPETTCMMVVGEGTDRSCSS